MVSVTFSHLAWLPPGSRINGNFGSSHFCCKAPYFLGFRPEVELMETPLSADSIVCDSTTWLPPGSRINGNARGASAKERLTPSTLGFRPEVELMETLPHKLLRLLGSRLHLLGFRPEVELMETSLGFERVEHHSPKILGFRPEVELMETIGSRLHLEVSRRQRLGFRPEVELMETVSCIESLVRFCIAWLPPGSRINGNYYR